jgi:hypothetical protein
LREGHDRTEGVAAVLVQGFCPVEEEDPDRWGRLSAREGGRRCNGSGGRVARLRAGSEAGPKRLPSAFFPFFILFFFFFFFFSFVS